MPRLSSLSIPPLLAMLCAVCLGTAAAQSLPTLALPSPAAALQALGGVRVEGLYRTAPVAVDGVPLFRIATPANVGSDQITVEARQQSIDAAIAQILAPLSAEPNAGTIYDPKTLHVAVQTQGAQPLIVATDGHHAGALALLTVTDVDGKYQKTPPGTLAQQWSAKLQSALVLALHKRQPAEVKRNVADLWHVALALAAVTLVVIVLQLLLRRKIVALRERIAKDARDMEAASSGDPERAAASQQRRRFMGLVIRASGPEMSLRAFKAFSAIVFAAVALAWFVAILWALSLFPQTTQTAHFLQWQVKRIGFILIASIVLVRVADILISQLARVYGENADSGDGEERARLLLRIPTIARSVSAFFAMIVVLVALLFAMNAVGISTGSVLTFGGILALGVTFAAQNLLRDFLNGAFVLVEDQYVVGDYVIVDQWSGTVEHMTLRVVQIRDSSGNLITIPHGQVTQVVNCSRNWSRVDYRVAIDPKADVVRATGVLRAAIEGLAGEEKYGGWMLDPIELIGVDALSATGIVLRATVKTAPLRQFELKREINARVIEGFRADGIALGIDPRTATPISINAGPA